MRVSRRFVGVGVVVIVLAGLVATVSSSAATPGPCGQSPSTAINAHTGISDAQACKILAALDVIQLDFFDKSGTVLVNYKAADRAQATSRRILDSFGISSNRVVAGYNAPKGIVLTFLRNARNLALVHQLNQLRNPKRQDLFDTESGTTSDLTPSIHLPSS
jgi:hypothetical protein